MFVRQESFGSPVFTYERKYIRARAFEKIFYFFCLIGVFAGYI